MRSRREARLRPEYAGWYPGIQIPLWFPAKALARARDSFSKASLATSNHRVGSRDPASWMTATLNFGAARLVGIQASSHVAKTMGGRTGKHRTPPKRRSLFSGPCFSDRSYALWSRA